MIVVCTFVILYMAEDGYPAMQKQRCQSCHECSDLVAAYNESGPPHWYQDQMVVAGCIQRLEEATPA